MGRNKYVRLINIYLKSVQHVLSLGRLQLGLCTRQEHTEDGTKVLVYLREKDRLTCVCVCVYVCV